MCSGSDLLFLRFDLGLGEFKKIIFWFIFLKLGKFYQKWQSSIVFEIQRALNRTLYLFIRKFSQKTMFFFSVSLSFFTLFLLSVGCVL